jgi:hypothetical protein
MTKAIVVNICIRPAARHIFFDPLPPQLQNFLANYCRTLKIQQYEVAVLNTGDEKLLAK